ncbi:MAG: hypothetical protein C4567_07195 [Deltaproteobacteria bacterium]|nr:MAG: hypothetical protein C4567_07195 [Deltaproteobacteria bacterium]
MFLAGISIRRHSLVIISQRLLGLNLSHAEISNANGELTAAVEGWCPRDLSQSPQEDLRYLFVDEVTFDIRLASSVEKVPVLVAVAVTTAGHKLVRLLC